MARGPREGGGRAGRTLSVRTSLKVGVGVAVGSLALAAKVVLSFSVWVLPSLVDAANVFAVLVALGVVAVLGRRRAPLATAVAVVVALGLPMLDVVVTPAVGAALVRDAEAYCEARSAGGSPARSLPVLFRPGYSVRYRASCDAHGGTFPDPFPGRTFWEGERDARGRWTWQRMMD